ncbi:MAG: hypothetical protein KKA90_02900 [Nanoarchaeota archaeon]|nr:hypothetical protein [Nanoarchaeota archaeon]
MTKIVKIETTTLEPFEKDARIVSIGIKDTQTGDVIILAEQDERFLLEQFWKQVTDRVIGFNFDFDYRWLIVRSLKHQVPVQQLVVTDLRTVLGLGKKFAPGKLEEFAELIGEGREKFHSREIPILWKLGKLEEIKSFNQADLELIEKLYERMKVIGLLR